MKRARKRKAGVALAALSALASCAASPPPVFDAEFRGPAGLFTQPGTWQYDTGYGIWGNNERETYTPSARLDGTGNLVIAAVAADGGYQSARLVSARSFGPGSFAARLNLAPAAGVWPAFWLLGTGKWPYHGEIDIMENFGSRLCESSVHVPVPGTSRIVTKSATVPDGTGWHTWQLNWTSTSLTFLMDEKAYFTVTREELPSWPFSRMQIVLNVAVGGAAGSPAVTSFPRQMLASSIKVWDSASAASKRR